MPIVSCLCGHQLNVSELLIGKQVTCNQCNRVQVVPGPVATSVEDPASFAATVPAAAVSPEAAQQYAQAAGYPSGGIAPPAAAVPPVGAAPQPGGYSTAGYEHPYAPPQAGGYLAPRQKGPGRWSLITGGVLAILTSLLWGAVGLAVLFSPDVLPMKFETMTFKQQLLYSVTAVCTLLSGLCIITASIGFAARTWAAVFTCGVMFVFAVITTYALIESHDTSKFSTFVGFAIPTFSALAFTAYGVIQARAIRRGRS
jgi:hypothetical protein